MPIDLHRHHSSFDERHRSAWAVVDNAGLDVHTAVVIGRIQRSENDFSRRASGGAACGKLYITGRSSRAVASLDATAAAHLTLIVAGRLLEDAAKFTQP